MLERVASAIALIGIAVWLGGLVALGALAAPVVFSVVPLPMSADAMTLVFRHFDVVAMACAALALATEAVRTLGRVSSRSRSGSGGGAFKSTRIDHTRAFLIALAAGAAVFQGAFVSPRIASLHASGVLRGVSGQGAELARLHDLAEWCGKAQVVLLAAAIVLQALGFSTQNGREAHPGAPG